MQNLREGQYYYAPHRSSWGVWRVGKAAPKSGARMDDFITDFDTKAQASNFVYKMNKWMK